MDTSWIFRILRSEFDHTVHRGCAVKYSSQSLFKIFSYNDHSVETRAVFPDLAPQF